MRKPLTLVASHDTVCIFDGATEVVRHARCYDRGREIEDPRHIEALVAIKRAARAPKGRDRLLAKLPRAEAFFERLLEREVPLAQATAQLARLLDHYGSSATDEVLAVALERETPALSSVALWLEQQRRRQHARPPVPITLPDRSDVRDLAVTPHDLETYDALSDNQARNAQGPGDDD